MYLSFQDYQSMGGKLSEPLFVRAEMMARMKIDSLTFNRLHNLEPENPTWEKVRFLVFELIERGYLGKLDGKDTQSESNSKVSVTWKDNSGKADELIQMYLPMFFSGGIIQGKVLRV